MVFYQGPIPIGNDSYIERDLVNILCGELLNERWVLFLGPRQHGKTTALIRVKKLIDDAGIQCVYVDLQQQPPLESYSGFVNWFSAKVAEQLGAEFEQDESLDDLQVALNRVLPEGTSRVVVLVDEASNIQRDDWRNSFFGQLRGLSSARAFAEDIDASKRLTFLFSGTFRPETLIDAANSPFNVCEKIETVDLTEEEVHRLAMLTLGEDERSRQISEKVFSAVGGQPYLIQRLLGKASGAENQQAALATAIDELKTGQADHIINLFSRYLAETNLTKLVATLAANGELDNSPADPDYAFLCTGGLAKRNGGKIIFRNAVYEEVAKTSPQIGNSDPAGERAPVFPLRPESFRKLIDDELREIAYSAQQGAVASYMGNSNRLALAGYGCSIEAILIDYLKRKSEQERRAAGQQAPQCNLNNFETYADAGSLRLVNLVKIANRLLGSNAQVPDALRDWRNLVHPSVATQNYMRDEQLAPEVRAAAALHEIFLRDLPEQP
ncbi:AAA-like domain-containing protein [Roseovarius nanhaiticus]|uniref:AAA-like domain-containing protein n=1 Tax=Roseovarius nanhaiticus TaxID=573024 RepID=A0A1N7HIC4_9RHOB|nr:AAA-like domain-containing protein [Roseovarius nanhaiticus]SEK92261.1 AAA-like domain-containing protein [Roseovarius nanhaiticus]SIS24636.1 AAA-like domain-containing protein [Roseovarius nanhaiticus]